MLFIRNENISDWKKKENLSDSKLASIQFDVIIQQNNDLQRLACELKKITLWRKSDVRQFFFLSILILNSISTWKTNILKLCFREI